MKECPACRSQLADDAITCSNCGGSYDVDGGFEAPWDVEMARLTAERERKVESAEHFGSLGKPHPHFFLESKGCLVFALALAAVAPVLVVALGALL